MPFVLKSRSILCVANKSLQVDWNNNWTKLMVHCLPWKADRTQLFKKVPVRKETKGSLPHSQKPAIRLCPEALQSSPHFRSLFLYDPFWYLSIYARSLIWHHPLRFPDQNFIWISHLPCAYFLFHSCHLWFSH